ncbi:MAG TPA: ACP S-malonyltransferase [Candidatus Mediterraneibacter cottocaccae]|nr:ACP S-malonyltransferase [Candidatus Mediterraneibacter cottocaccae]
MKTAFIYTGQGFQRPGMLHALPDHPAAGEYLQRTKDILECSIDQLDTADALSSNENTQICIYVCETVWSWIMREKWQCDTVSGHSAGSFAAAVEAGVLSFEDGLVLIRTRGKYMEKMFPSGYGMYAVSGITESLMYRILEQFKHEYPDALVFPATVNEELQCTISGSLEWLERLTGFIHRDYPAKVTPLRVKVPSHCCLMDPVTDVLRRASEKMQWKRPRIPAVVNSRARRVWTAEEVKEDLIVGAARMVRWYDGITLMKELGIDTFIEIGSAHTLTEIGRRSFPELRWLSGER